MRMVVFENDNGFSLSSWVNWRVGKADLIAFNREGNVRNHRERIAKEFSNKWRAASERIGAELRLFPLGGAELKIFI
ncbi:hypothetical protein CEXT_37931 [Caerostris extrusa]|uniref:Uncharacterized protein n=1 Tax=Caerostris extrusa TaxID=172846 RepID=A0AAV4TVJ8_CAEEX|nr:hypothetical protein CEXT_37931 [Caerostris extrusa]